MNSRHKGEKVRSFPSELRQQLQAGSEGFSPRDPLWKVGEAMDPNVRHSLAERWESCRLVCLSIQKTFTECPLCARQCSKHWWCNSNQKAKREKPWSQGIDCHLISLEHLLRVTHCLCAGASAVSWTWNTHSSGYREGYSGVQEPVFPILYMRRCSTERLHNMFEITQLAQAVRTHCTVEYPSHF